MQARRSEARIERRAAHHGPVRKRLTTTKRATRERGVAIVTVLLIVALVATLAASLLWREWVAVRDVENQRVATQTMWVERAAVEWARAELRLQTSTSGITQPAQRWAAPVQDTRLADLLPADVVAVNSDLEHATISGEVEDAQAKFNLLNLVTRPGPSAPFQIDVDGLAAYRRLLSGAGLDPALAKPTADHLLRALAIGPRNGNSSDAGDWPLQPTSIDDFASVPGYDPHTIGTLAPLVTVLPDTTMINANTASPEVLAAAIPTLTHGQADTLINRRNTAYFVSTGDVATTLYSTLGNGQLPLGSIVGVTSSYFIVHCRIRSERINMRMDTLIARYGIGDFSWTVVTWVHRLSG